MLSVTLEYEVPHDRTLIVKLPNAVQPGKHELIVVINEQPLAAPLPESGEDPLAFQQRLREEWE